MARAEPPRERIGEMLLSLGLITRAQLDEALGAQQASQLPIGKQLVALGALSETRLTQVLSSQLSVPWVTLDRVEFPAELLARIPSDLADECSVLPVYVRSIRGKGTTLYVAMDDPTDEDALDRVSRAVGIPVRPMIAPPSEIRRVIDHRYFGLPLASANLPEENTGLRHLPRRGAPPKPPGSDGKPKAPAPPKKPPPPPGPAPRAEGVVAIEQYEMPSQPPASPGRTLTLLDGTQIKLPTGRAQRESVDVAAVRHVIKAVKSARIELGSDEPLRWHDLLQAVLDALESRGVRLTREEVADAWLRERKKERPAKGTP